MSEKLTDPTTDKAALRRRMLAHRQAISGEVRLHLDAAIGERVLAWWSAHRIGTLGVYLPIRGEPDLRKIYEELARRGTRLALPLAERDNPLRFAAWKPGDALGKDAFGVPAPLAPHVIEEPDALLIPCVGFNAQHFRLGYGGGFYDRTLVAVSCPTLRPIAIGIAYEINHCDFVEDAHDVALDAIITETSPMQNQPPSR